MRLDALVAGADTQRIIGDAGVEVADLAYDSRRAKPGQPLLLRAGERVDRHDLASAAVEAGAVALVVERELELRVPQVVVASARAAMAPLAARFWGDPTSELRVAGITGTNGKTTTAFLVREILGAAGMQCGLLGTVKQVVGGAEEEVERTTPEAIDLQATFRRMLDSDDAACAMEVSSHALALHRTDAIHFDVALFTNLTQDHLDFHADMEDYFQSKRRLFEMAPRVAVVNVDDPYGRRLAEEFDCVDLLRRGRRSGLLRPRDIADAGRCGVRSRGGGHEPWYRARRRSGLGSGGVLIKTRLPGHFNVANALGASAAATAIGVEAGEAAAGARPGGPGPGALRADRRGPGLRGARRLRPHARTPWRTCCGRRGPSPRGA